jgi:hypothetical protein
VLRIIEEAGTKPWSLSEGDARWIASLLGETPVQVEYWPRARAQEAFERDVDRHPDVYARDGYYYEPCFANGLRGYSFGLPEEDGRDEVLIAVIFVDELETYESATFVVLHELAHLLVDPRDDDELHADLIASVLMGQLGYGEGIREAKKDKKPKRCPPRA